MTLRVRFARGTLDRELVNELVDSIASRPAPYKAGRLALRARLVSEARRVFRSSARLGADEPWFEKELIASEDFSSLLDTLWPSVFRHHAGARTALEPEPTRTGCRGPLRSG